MRHVFTSIAVLLFSLCAVSAQEPNSSPKPDSSAQPRSDGSSSAPNSGSNQAKMKPCDETTPEPCLNAPVPIKQPDPVYSLEARKKKIVGQVTLWLKVDTDGVPQHIRVVRSLGYGLDEEAIKAVKEWRFKPATYGGTPIATQVNVVVDFRLFK